MICIIIRSYLVIFPALCVLQESNVLHISYDFLAQIYILVDN